jgi:hypothetical protein
MQNTISTSSAMLEPRLGNAHTLTAATISQAYAFCAY